MGPGAAIEGGYLASLKTTGFCCFQTEVHQGCIGVITSATSQASQHLGNVTSVSAPRPALRRRHLGTSATSPASRHLSNVAGVSAPRQRRRRFGTSAGSSSPASRHLGRLFVASFSAPQQRRRRLGTSVTSPASRHLGRQRRQRLGTVTTAPLQRRRRLGTSARRNLGRLFVASVSAPRQRRRRLGTSATSAPRPALRRRRLDSRHVGWNRRLVASVSAPRQRRRCFGLSTSATSAPWPALRRRRLAGVSTRRLALASLRRRLVTMYLRPVSVFMFRFASRLSFILKLVCIQVGYFDAHLTVRRLVVCQIPYSEKTDLLQRQCSLYFQGHPTGPAQPRGR
jgi:hypothetical protein